MKKPFQTWTFRWWLWYVQPVLMLSIMYTASSCFYCGFMQHLETWHLFYLSIAAAGFALIVPPGSTAADSLQQQGERRKGLEAAAKFEAAAAKYQDALDAAVCQRHLHGFNLIEDGANMRTPTGGNIISLEEAIEMRSSLAECHQLLADALVAAAASLPDTELNPQVERQAAATAVQHLTTALRHYSCCHPSAVLTSRGPNAAAGVTPGAGVGDAALPPEVAVNAGNCAASLGELLEEEAERTAAASSPPMAWLPMYDIALQCYRSAAASYKSAVAREEDVLTLSNLGDVLVQSGTCLYAVSRALRDADPVLAASALSSQTAAAAAAAPSEWAAAREAEAQSDFMAAMSSYETACSMCDSSQGDDLPGLLCNWGSALRSLAGCLQDPAARLGPLEQAASRLDQAASFDRADPAPLCSLGDVLMAGGEAAEAISLAAVTSAVSNTPEAQAEVLPAMAPEAEATAAAARHWYGIAMRQLHAALTRGYSAALTLRRDEPEALVGCGEAHLALSRLARRDPVAAAASGDGGGDGDGDKNAAGADAKDIASRHATAAVVAFQAAVARPERLGGWRQRCDVRYNLACALALVGREQEAHQLLVSLLGCGAVRPSELARDVDLEPVRYLPWFQALLAAA
ncbi:hypothetical protein Vafri_8116 [Volvox africanus]|uniref:Uncharacterized protein n=1 Tax=Volvox africanus TaxID=51714 RepID=A0A8J4B1I8_9CHLO|nr:hypothetical protein Vafri_8116 [Volvox africanus]